VPSVVSRLSALRQLNVAQNEWLTALPASLFPPCCSLRHLQAFRCALEALPVDIGSAQHLQSLDVQSNRLSSVPRSIGRLRCLRSANFSRNRLTSVPSELRGCTLLSKLILSDNKLAWLPVDIGDLPALQLLVLGGNPLPVEVPYTDNCIDRLPLLFGATTGISMMRDRATTICVGLQDFGLPALVTLEILDAAFANDIPMFQKWQLITAVKHFHKA
jgi:Leucine-rich repeat (LRR) protein